jgi:cation:H+ antiporter
MVLHPFIVFLSGLLILIAGAELLLRGASRLADMLGMSPVMIGLTIVALGTSIPELAVGLTAVSEGKGGLSVGNIAGANIISILFILGLTALIRPMSLTQIYLKLDLAVMVAAGAMLAAMGLDGRLTPQEGLLLALGAVAYTIVILRTTQRRRTIEAPPAEASRRSDQAFNWAEAAWHAAMLAIGISLTLFGADLLVSGAVALARAYGVSETLIGLTIVSLGTTTPELATALLGIVRNKRNVAVGTLIGSYIYNILVILGITMLFSGQGIMLERNVVRFDLPFMAAVAIMCAWVCRSDHRLSRAEGAMFMMVYLAYICALLVFRT